MKTIYFDGGARGNGTPDCLAGYAMIDPSMAVEITDVVIGATNNEMEYAGLLEAMLHAIRSGYTHVTFVGDSQLVVEQVNRRWKCKAPNLQGKCAIAIGYLALHPGWHVKWVPRDENLADAAYNKRLDQYANRG